jgi:hypothetical protein
MTDLEIYYNKFNEDKRLNSRHGQVEYITSMKYIHIYLDEIARIFLMSVQLPGVTASHSPRRATM